MFQVPEEMIRYLQISSASFIGFRGSPQSEIACWSPLGGKTNCHLPKAFWGSSITWVSLKCVVSIISLWQLDMACWKISKIIVDDVDVPIEMSISNGFPAMFDDREATTACTGVDEGHLKEMVPYHQLL
jgi:hypothetical protein